jgi:hypothetical protein
MSFSNYSRTDIVETYEKNQLQVKDWYMWVCGLHPHTHIYPSLLLAGDFFSALVANIQSRSYLKIGFNPKEI